jgi:glycosyltransferase involved in cell wall biosynthesis
MKQLAEIEKETAEKADLAVTVSRYSAKKAVELYDLDSRKVRVAPNGVDPEIFKPMDNVERVRRQIGLDEKLCVLFVGRLIPRKGLSFLVEAAEQVVKEIEA